MGIFDKLRPSNTIIHPVSGVIVSEPHDPEQLTQDERVVFGTTIQIMQRVLNNHGVFPNGKELNFIAAEVADYVMSEAKSLADSAVARVLEDRVKAEMGRLEGEAAQKINAAVEQKAREIGDKYESELSAIRKFVQSIPASPTPSPSPTPASVSAPVPTSVEKGKGK